MKPVNMIQVESISKRYSLGAIGSTNLRESLTEGIKSLFRKRNTRDNGEFWALKDVSFEVQQGEVVGIIGKNGAGKSTLLKILSRITEPTRGRVVLKGRVASLLEVGTGFHPELTGRENIFLNGSILGMGRAEIRNKFDEIVDFSGVEKFLDTPVKRYSSGMYVRLAFSVAAHLEPEVLVIDEVLSVGDAEFQKKCLGKMNDVAEDGRTILFVSHNMTAVEGLCTRAILLESGQKFSEGTPHDMVSLYRNRLDLSSQSSLAERKDRSGNGDFRFIGVTINDNRPALPGEPLRLDLHYRALPDRIENIHLAITICNQWEERLMAITNYSQGASLDITNDEGVVRVTLPKNYLIPNLYRLNLWSAVKNIVTDYVYNAATLEVEHADFFGTGQGLNPSQHGYFYPELCEWKVQ